MKQINKLRNEMIDCSIKTGIKSECTLKCSQK
ncbi:aspartyl-phosphate phosphatase Spo0E family protein [Fredinandcohnia humi]